MSVWDTFGKAHTAVYRWSNGRLGARMAGLDMLILTTTGRKSGQLRSVVLPYLKDGDRYVIVGSNSGAEFHPGWWLNLQRHSNATVQIGPEHKTVSATLADPAERARLWPVLTQINQFYARYEQRTKREIPVVILQPV